MTEFDLPFRKTIYVVVLLIVCIAPVSAGQFFPADAANPQQDSVLQNDSLPKKELLLSEIIQRSNKNSRTLERLMERLSDSTRYAALTEQFNEFTESQQTFNQERFNQDLGALTNRELISLINVMEFQKRSVESLIDDYKEGIDQLDRERREVEDIYRFWKGYLSESGVNYKDAILDGQIGDILDNAQDMSGIYMTRIEALLVDLNKLDATQGDLEDEIERTSNKLDGLSSLFDKGRISIWQAFQGFSFTRLTSEVSLYADLISYDLENALSNLLGTHLVVLALFLLIYFMCIRTRKQLETREYTVSLSVGQVERIFQMPLITALFLTFLFSSLLYLEAPAVINDVSGLLLILALYIISKKIFKAGFLKVIRIFIYSWLILKVGEVMSFESLIGRILLLILNILLLYMIFYSYRNRDIFSRLQKDPRYRHLTKVFLGVVFAAVGISLICNILGFLNVSVYLSSLIVKLSLLSLYLYLWNPIFKAFINLRLQGKYLSSKRSVSSNKMAIQKFASRFINLITYFVFIYSVLNLLEIYSLIYDQVWGFINDPITLGSTEFTLWNLLLFIIIVWTSILISKIVRTLLKDEVLAYADLERGLPDTLSMLARYAIIAIGFFIAITSLGFEMNQLAIIFGAFSVGIGFGLQNIFNNLVSGLILIFERPIHIEDTIEVNNMVGSVSNIGIRSSNVRTLDGAEVIIPNGQLISNEVINWTLSDQNRRIEIVVGVAYGSDVHKVAALLREILNAHDGVLKTPEPAVLFQEFADSSLNFRLLFWTGIYKDWLRIQSEVHFKINDVFAAEGIQIPFPQRDIHIQSGNAKPD